MGRSTSEKKHCLAGLCGVNQPHLKLGRPLCHTWLLNMHTEPAGPHGATTSDSSDGSPVSGSMQLRPKRCEPRTHSVGP